MLKLPCALDEDAVLDVGDHLIDGRRSLRARLELDVRHAQERIVAPVVRERAAAAFLLADEVRGLAVRLQADEDAVLHERPLLRLHAVVVEADGRHAGGERAIGGDVEVLRAVFQLADVGDLHEARAGVVRLVAGDAIELGRVRDDLVNRQRRGATASGRDP